MGLQPCLQARAPWATHCGERSCCLLASPVNGNHLLFQLADRSPILIASLRPRCYGSLKMGCGSTQNNDCVKRLSHCWPASTGRVRDATDDGAR